MNSGRIKDTSNLAVSPPLTPAGELQRRWQAGQEPKLEAFVAEWSVELPQELAEVVRVDLRERWRRGERPAVHEYLCRFPQLRSAADLTVDVIYAEFLVREELGHKPALADYQRQYPEHATELGDQVELHQALEANGDCAPGVS